MSCDIIWDQDIKGLGFGIHQNMAQSSKTLESELLVNCGFNQ